MFENYEFSDNLAELVNTGDWSAVQTYVEASPHGLFEYTLHVAFTALLS